jgi:DNA-binding MarR family transcriptional regulator
MKKQDSASKIIELWMEITRILRQKAALSGKDKNFNPMQFHALMIIRQHEGLTMKEFADFLKITSPSATTYVNRLVKLKLVERKADPKNRKLVRLGLSAQGKTMLQKRMHDHSRLMHGVFLLLSKEDQRAFARILGNLRDALLAEQKL